MRGFTLMEVLVAVAILAVLAVVAIPAFTAHMRRAKSAEAIDNIERIYKGAATYFMSPRVEASTGDMLGCQFPDTAPLTPDIGVDGRCCDAALDGDGDGRCDVNAARWDHPTWSALSFSMTDQHYYHYGFGNIVVTPGVTLMNAGAAGDLDCDGIPAEFRKAGYGVHPSGADCQLRSSSAFYMENASE